MNTELGNEACSREDFEQFALVKQHNGAGVCFSFYLP